MNNKETMDAVATPLWITMSVPGKKDDGSDTAWFAYHPETFRSVACDTRSDAVRLVNKLNEEILMDPKYWSVAERTYEGRKVYFLLAHGVIQSYGWLKREDAEKAFECFKEDGTSDTGPAYQVLFDDIGQDFTE